MSSLPRLSSKPVLRPFAVPGKDLATDVAYVAAAIQLDPGISAQWVFDAIMHHVAELPSLQEFEKIKERMEEAEFQLDEAPREDDHYEDMRDLRRRISVRIENLRHWPVNEIDGQLVRLGERLDDEYDDLT